MPLTDSRFRTLGVSHRHLVVLPAWQCGPEQSPGGQSGFATLGLLAARQRLTINSYYAGRYGPEPLAFHCRTLPHLLEKNGAAADTAYVVSDALLPWFEARFAASHSCRVADGLNLCTRR